MGNRRRHLEDATPRPEATLGETPAARESQGQSSLRLLDRPPTQLDLGTEPSIRLLDTTASGLIRIRSYDEDHPDATTFGIRH